MCKWLDVKPRSYFAYIKNESFRHDKQTRNNEVDKIVLEKFKELKSFAGYKSIHGTLKTSGKNISRYAVEKSMLRQCLVPKLKRKSVKTTKPNKNNELPKDLVKRNFRPPVAFSVLVGDITYIRINNGFCYLSTVIDLTTRMLVGYCISNKMTVDIVIKSLIKAKVSGYMLGNTIFHSDRGSQYTSKALSIVANMLDIRLSVGRTGSCHDNAVAESLFSTMKREAGESFKDINQAESEIVDWIYYYNKIRPHSTIGYNTPYQEYEKYHKMHHEIDCDTIMK